MIVPREIIDCINNHQSFLAHAHLGPDADSVGSILAIKLGLESIGKVVNLYCEDDLPINYSFLPSITSIQKMELIGALTQNYDVYLTLDTAKWGMVSHAQPPVIPRKLIVNIDHHPESIVAKINWVEPKAVCTSQMIYHLLKKLDIKITPEIATCILAGIINDTGTFQNTNCTPEIFILTARLQKLGADYNNTVIEISRSNSFEELKVWAALLKNLKLSPSGDFVWTTLNNEEWKACHTRASMGSFANAIISRVVGTKFGAVLVEKYPGETKGALRSRYPAIDVAQIAACLNGGGHTAAAGFRLEKNLKMAERDFLQAVSTLKSTNKL